MLETRISILLGVAKYYINIELYIYIYTVVYSIRKIAINGFSLGNYHGVNIEKDVKKPTGKHQENDVCLDSHCM